MQNQGPLVAPMWHHLDILQSRTKTAITVTQHMCSWSKQANAKTCFLNTFCPPHKDPLYSFTMSFCLDAIDSCVFLSTCK